MTQDQSLGGDTTENGTTAPSTGDSAAFTIPELPEPPVLEKVLDIDEVMSQARRVERVARICLRSDLTAELDDLVEKLGNLVNDQGRILETDEDKALSDQSEAIALHDRIHFVQVEMAKSMRTVRMRALASDDWEPFDKKHRDAKGEIKNTKAYYDELITRCAIEPTISPEQLAGFRTVLGQTQIVELGNTAFYACSTGGVDVPKLQLFSPSPRQNPSGRS